MLQVTKFLCSELLQSPLHRTTVACTCVLVASGVIAHLRGQGVCDGQGRDITPAMSISMADLIGRTKAARLADIRAGM